MQMQNKQSVYIVDDDPAMRDSLCLLLQTEDLHAMSFDSADEFLKNLDDVSGGCLLLDVRMPGLSGLELQKLIRQKALNMAVIIMTGYADVPMAVEAMKNGAVDFIEKPFDNSRLINTVHFCLKKCNELQTEQEEQHGAEEKIERLTRRERQVMDMLVAGKQNRVIAEKLGISPRTVEIHRARVMEKLEANSLSDVVRLALMANHIINNIGNS